MALFARRPGRKSSLRVRIAFFLFALGCLSMGNFYSQESTGSLAAPSSGRTLLADEPSTCDAYQGRSTGYVVQSILIFLLLTLYVFIGVAIICDEFFEPSLELICDKLSLSDDVAGATFMAAGSSAPELFTSLSDVFGTKNSIGIGTIVGSAVFNLVCICGLSSAVTGLSLVLDWRPLIRDSAFYFTAICVLVAVVSDGQVRWYEALITLSGYALYLTFMYNNQKLLLKLGPAPEPDQEHLDPEGAVHSDLEAVPTEDSSEEEEAQEAKTEQGASAEGESTVSEPAHPIVEKMRAAEGLFQDEEILVVETALQPKSDDDDDEEGPLMAVLAWPYHFIFSWTVPKCDEEEYEKYYIVSFLMCCLWIGVLSFSMAFFATGIGCLVGLDPGVMGLTLVAAGTSVPDAMASITVAREGKGNMAVSNAIGSNVFDIFLGLGLPWTLACLFYQAPVSVASKTEGVLFQAFIRLVFTLVVLLASLKFCNWVLTPKCGYFLISLYVLFVITSFATNVPN